jgi:hypothetical protein
MKTPSLKEDLKTLELGSEYFPRFTRDTTDDDVKNTMKRLKEKVKEQRELLVTKGLSINNTGHAPSNDRACQVDQS